MPRHRRGPTEKEKRMRALLREHEKSGLTMTEFARRKRLPRSRLAWWKHRLAHRPVPPTRKVRRQAEAMIPVSVTPFSIGSISGRAIDQRIRIEVPEGVSIEVPRDCSPEEVCALLRAVRSAC